MFEELDDTQNEMAAGLLEPQVKPEPVIIDKEATVTDSHDERMAPGLTTPGKGRQWDPAKSRERMRGVLAIGLLLNVPLVLVVSIAALSSQQIAPQDLQNLLNVIFIPITTLLGAAVGFYYGQRSGSRQP